MHIDAEAARCLGPGHFGRKRLWPALGTGPEGPSLVASADGYRPFREAESTDDSRGFDGEEESCDAKLASCLPIDKIGSRHIDAKT